MNKVFLPRMESGRTIPSTTYQIAASQDIKRGDALTITSAANTLEQAIALPGSDNTVTASSGNLVLAGFAAEDIVTNAAGVEASTGRNSIQVYEFGPALRFGLRAFNATSTSAQFQDFTIGVGYNIGRWRGASAGIWGYVITTGTTNPELYIIDYYPGWAATDAYPVFFCRVAISETIQGL